MLAFPDLTALIATGLLLGWSVAWPPGPINAEIARRAVARGFWPAVAVGLGACLGDATWALGVALGAGALAQGPTMIAVMGALSLTLLVVLAGLFLRAAWRKAWAWRAGTWTRAVSAIDSTRAGFLFGLVAALTSPWNVAFWLAVIGRPDMVSQGLAGALVVAGAVIVGTAAWVFAFATAIAVFRAQLDGPAWDVLTHGLTGCLMLVFAAKTALSLAAS